MCEEIAENELLRDARCCPGEIKKSADFGEQIDLLIRLGSLLIVGEVKCWLYPADPFERFMHLRKLREAAEQANRKASVLASRPDIAAKALGLTEEECRGLRVVPLVVANQGFGFSLKVDGCLVTDSAFLLTYLGAGSIITSAAIDPRNGRMVQAVTKLYENEAQAGAKLEEVLAAPFVLNRFVDRISWSENPFPALVGDPVYFATPRLGDVLGEERGRAEAMGRVLREAAE
jgi:hypothetical protein